MLQPLNRQPIIIVEAPHVREPVSVVTDGTNNEERDEGKYDTEIQWQIVIHNETQGKMLQIKKIVHNCYILSTLLYRNLRWTISLPIKNRPELFSSSVSKKKKRND